MIDMKKLAYDINQALRHQPVTDINVIVRDREIIAQSKSYTDPKDVLEITVKLHIGF